MRQRTISFSGAQKTAPAEEPVMKVIDSKLGAL